MKKTTTNSVHVMFLGLTLSLISCQTTPHRQPSSVDVPTELKPIIENLYREKFQSEITKEQLEIIKRKRGTGNTPRKNEQFPPPTPPYEKEFKALTAQYQKSQQKQDAELNQAQPLLSSVRSDTPVSILVRDATPWRQQNQEVELKNPADFALAQGRPTHVFNFDRVRSTAFEVRIKNYLLSYDDPHEDRKNDFLEASITCDAPFSIKRTFSDKKYGARQTATFRLYDSKYNGDNLRLIPSSYVKECEFKAGEAGAAPLYGARFVEPANPYLELHSLVEGCLMPRTDNLSGIQKFFLTDKFDSMTCPEAVPAVINLPDAEDSLKSKAETLLGQPLPRGFMDLRDPMAPLDFSKAPFFDSIYVSYLVFRADYYGTFMSRLLEFHAQRGSKIKIMIAGVITLDKDVKMLHSLVARNPNIQLQELKYQVPAGGSLGDRFDRLHRSMHVKLLLTMSKSQPQNNVAFIGGRNIHDGFIFKTPYDYSNPDMVNYVKGDESFVHWRDFEFKIHSKDFTEKVAAHFLTIWDRDAKTMQFRSININLPLASQASPAYFNNREPLIRHYVSVPYKDEQRLIDLYVEMLDSAKKKIMISTPYFRPPKPIFEALERAAARGVDVTVITRLDLKGDTVDWILSESNKPTVNKLYQKIALYEYTEPKVILHSKIVLIDDVFSFLGSVNWNKRSFFHDMENGTMIYGAAYNREMTDIYNQYKRDSRLIEERLKRNYFKALIVGIFDTEF
ncbi:phosphatidylserine/phosphatidylglycerophosphate/cardiolipin synthase family protein [Bdellovibrio sp.]|uniref:phospholipase D-like domain-containing protein n=1 Tax=Bdellovibrio sp. TaxID=28201 RepID=UPI003221D53C